MHHQLTAFRRFSNERVPCIDFSFHRSTFQCFALRMLLAMKLCNDGTTRGHFTIFFNLLVSGSIASTSC